MLDHPILDEICRNVMRSYTDSAAQRSNENKNVAKIGLVSRQAHNMTLSILEDLDLITFIKVRNTYKAVLKRPFKNIRCDYIVKDTSKFNRQAEVELLIPIDFVTYFWKKFPHKLWALEVPFWYCGNDEILETLNKIRNIEFIILPKNPRNEGAKDCLKNVFENNKTTLKHVDDEFGTAIALKLIPPNLRLQTYYIDVWKCYTKKFISNRDDSRAFEIEMMPHARLVQNNIDESVPPVNTIIYLMNNRASLFKLGLQNSTAEKFVIASRYLALLSDQDFEPNNRVKEVVLSYLHGPPNDTSIGLKWPGHQEKLVRVVAELSKYLNALEKVSLKFTLMDRAYGKGGYFYRENNEELFMQFCDEFKKSMLTFLVLFEIVNSRFNFEIFFHLVIQYEKYGIVDRTTLEQHFPDCHWVIEELNPSQVQVRETRYQDRIICVFSVSRLFVNGNHRFKAEALILGMQPPSPEELDRRPPRTMQLARKVVGPQPHSSRQLAKKVITPR